MAFLLKMSAFSWLTGEDKSKKLYSVEANAPEKAGETKPRRHWLIGADGKLIDTLSPNVTTLYDNFMKSVELVGIILLIVWLIFSIRRWAVFRYTLCRWWKRWSLCLVVIQ
jgi:hypothetical protein